MAAVGLTMRIWVRIGIVAAVVAGGALFVRGGMAQTRRAIMYWCANALTEVLDARTTGDLAFSELEYTWPGRLELRGVTIVEDGVNVLAARSIVLTLAEVPQVGRPFVVDSIEITAPRLTLRPSASGVGWAGFAPFLRPESEAETSAPVRPDLKGEAPPLSELFAVRTLTVRGAAVQVHDGDDVWRLDDLDLDCTGGPDDAGGYGVRTEIVRGDLLRVALEGRVHLDTGDVELREGTLDVVLGAETRGRLAPPLSTWIETHDLRGRISLGMEGAWPGGDWVSGEGRVEVLATEIHMQAAGAHWPLRSVEGVVRLEERRLVTDGVVFAGLGGTSTVVGSLEPRGNWIFTADADAAGLRIEDLRLPPGAADDGGVRGRVDLVGRVEGTLAGTPDLVASGTIKVFEGRLARVPVFDALVKTIDGAIDGGPRDRDRADARWTWTDKRLALEQLRVVGPAVAARGAGEVYADGRVDLRLNAGPLERTQEALGDLGALFGRISDALEEYHVTGPYDDPQVTARPLGIGALPTP